MVTPTATTDVLSDLRAGPHWRVVIHPREFNKTRIASLGECWSAVEESQVRLRGWPYPYVNQECRKPGSDWIASEVDGTNHREHWRLYQSGQFVHFFSFWEDRSDRHAAGGELSVVGALYTFTEIFEFAARLAAAGMLDDAPVVQIWMEQVRNRELTGNGLVWLSSGFRAAEEPIEGSWQMQGPGLYAEAARLGREAAIHFFERFGCLNFSRETLQRTQEDFLARRAP